MAQTNFTPILLYGSITPSNVPIAANLTNSATGSEIAINVADKNLFFKDSTNAVNTVPIRQSSTSSNGWLSSTDWNTFNNKSNTNGTVTSVAALTIGTTGTDLSSTVANGTTTPVITLQVPTASATNRGALSSTDWTTFNGKQAALVSGTNIKTVNGTTLLGSGDLGIITGTYGGTGVNNGASTITIGGSVSYVGAYTQTWTRTANTSLTLPISGYVISTVTNMAANPVTGTPSSSNFLRGDGTWAVPTAGTGTVTSVAASVPDFLSISGSPITTSGTLAITLSGTALPTANGGTGLTGFTAANKAIYSTSSSVLTAGTLPVLAGGTGTTTATGSGSLVLQTAPVLYGIVGIGTDAAGGSPSLQIGPGNNGHPVFVMYPYNKVSGPNTNYTQLYFNGDGSNFFVINTSNGVYLANNGTSWASASDETRKDIIEPITNALEKLSQIRSVIGKYKTDPIGTRRVFFLAQDFEKVLSEAVTKSTDNAGEFLGLQYQDASPLLAAAINELSAKFDAYVASHP